MEMRERKMISGVTDRREYQKVIFLVFLSLGRIVSCIMRLPSCGGAISNEQAIEQA